MRPPELKYLAGLLTFLLIVPGIIIGCKPGPDSQNPGIQDSVAMTEELQDDASIDLEGVTPEVLWETVGELYQSDGPRTALYLLDQGITQGIVTNLEADQTRAVFLHDLGRLDEAFLTLMHYNLDAEHANLLRLRAEILWKIARFSEAKRDYEIILESQGNEAESDLLFSMVRLYDFLGEWENAENIRDRIRSRSDDPYLFVLELWDAIRSEDITVLTDAADTWSGQHENEDPADPLYVLSRIMISNLKGDTNEAASVAREYLVQDEFNYSIAMTLLSIDVENSDFEAFETDLRIAMGKLDAIQWLDTPENVIPSFGDRPLEAAGLLGAASALELGRGNRDRARLLAERAKMLNPYDYVASLQLAAISMTEGDIQGLFESLNEAVEFAPPSDVRTRLRLIFFSPLINDAVENPEEMLAPIDDLDEILQHWESVYPDNAFFKEARAELTGWKGDPEGALRILDAAFELPGSTRELNFRRAYFLSRLGRTDEASDIINAELPEGSPFLTWVSALEQEAEVRADESLAEFATLIRNRLDPLNIHDDFFNRTALE